MKETRPLEQTSMQQEDRRARAVRVQPCHRILEATAMRRTAGIENKIGTRVERREKPSRSAPPLAFVCIWEHIRHRTFLIPLDIAHLGSEKRLRVRTRRASPSVSVWVGGRTPYATPYRIRTGDRIVTNIHTPGQGAERGQQLCTAPATGTAQAHDTHTHARTCDRSVPSWRVLSPCPPHARRGPDS